MKQSAVKISMRLQAQCNPKPFTLFSSHLGDASHWMPVRPNGFVSVYV